MKSMVPNTLAAFIGLFLAERQRSARLAQEAAPQAQPADEARKQVTEIRIGYLRAYAPQLALSVLDVPPRDEGIAGAKVAIGDNNTTGKFMGQKFTLDVIEVKPDTDVVPAFNEMAAKGDRYVLADISARQLLSIADIARDNGVLIFNVGATDDILREEECRVNVFHTAPTRTMLADGLAQYLIWKQWPRWVLIYGSHERDQLFADALRRAATRFGGEIVAEKEFKDTGTARRTDSGVVQIQRQMPVFTQDLPDHDVVLVADESEVFGTYVPFRTWIPRPVAGTAGLIPSAWHPASEQWGGTQIQNRFAKAQRPAHAVEGHGSLDGGPHNRRRGDAHAGRRPAKDRGLHPRRRFFDRRVQGPEADLPQMELAVAPADLPRRRAFGRLDLAPGGVPAPVFRTGHAGIDQPETKCAFK